MNDELECCASARNGWWCTEPAGHDALHVARGMDGTVFAAWNDCGGFVDRFNRFKEEEA